MNDLLLRVESLQRSLEAAAVACTRLAEIIAELERENAELARRTVSAEAALEVMRRTAPETFPRPYIRAPFREVVP